MKRKGDSNKEGEGDIQERKNSKGGKIEKQEVERDEEEEEEGRRGET